MGTSEFASSHHDENSFNKEEEDHQVEEQYKPSAEIMQAEAEFF